jgi:hypothetical protein
MRNVFKYQLNQPNAFDFCRCEYIYRDWPAEKLTRWGLFQQLHAVNYNMLKSAVGTVLGRMIHNPYSEEIKAEVEAKIGKTTEAHLHDIVASIPKQRFGYYGKDEYHHFYVMNQRFYSNSNNFGLPKLNQDD